MAKIQRNVFVTRHGGVIGNDDSTDDEIEAALRAVVQKLGRAKVQTLLAALEDDSGAEDDDEELANGGQEIEAANALRPGALLFAPPGKREERAQHTVVSTNDGEPAPLGLTPRFLLARPGGGR